MTFEMWWQYNGWRVYELLWAVVAVVGLAIAVRRAWRRRPAARWAVAAFAVMLLPGVYTLAVYGSIWLKSNGLEWAVWWLDREPRGLYLPQLFRAAGFALLVPAIFAGRVPKTPADPDAG